MTMAQRPENNKISLLLIFLCQQKKKQNQANADFYSSGLCSDFYSFWLVLFFLSPCLYGRRPKGIKKTKQPIKARAKIQPLLRSAP